MNDARLWAIRNASSVAVATLALSVVGTGVALLAAHSLAGLPYLGTSDMVYVACQILPYGSVGAILVARRPDLPFGWLLSLAAMTLVVMLAIAGPALLAIQHDSGGQLAVWGLGAGTLMFVPAALEGLINTRFPSGRSSGRWGRALDRAIIVGIAVGVASGVLGDSVQHSVYPDGIPGGAGRFIDNTWVVDVANAAVIAVPVAIGLGAVAGITILVRFFRSNGLERRQLQWRAVGVVGALLLFPLVASEALPESTVYTLAATEPLWFVATLVVPVLRYDLWAVDSIIRRSATATFTSSASVVDNTIRAAADMLHLPYLAIRRGDLILASTGSRTEIVESWPVMVGSEVVGELVASPRHGFERVSEHDRLVLATIAQLVGNSVRAESLTADLQATRQRLVAAREEERRRLRRDLHDRLGPLLTGLGLNLDAAIAQLDGAAGRSSPTTTYLGNAKDASSQVISEIRVLVNGLRPPALDELGLTGALKLHLETLATDARLGLTLRLPDSLELPAAIEVAVFHTAVEAVTNVIRHSNACHVDVHLEEHDGDLIITVTDDGTTQTEWTPGVGLTGMRERADELGGTLLASPTPNGGRIRAVYPLGDD